MVNRLFVRDFAPHSSADDLEVLFSGVGTVRSVTLTDLSKNGTIRRVAYIEMSSRGEILDCIDRFHGMKEDGFTLTVTEDKPHVPDPDYHVKAQAARKAQKAAAVPPKPKKRLPPITRVES